MNALEGFERAEPVSDRPSLSKGQGVLVCGEPKGVAKASGCSSNTRAGVRKCPESQIRDPKGGELGEGRVKAFIRTLEALNR